MVHHCFVSKRRPFHYVMMWLNPKKVSKLMHSWDFFGYSSIISLWESSFCTSIMGLCIWLQLACFSDTSFLGHILVFTLFQHLSLEIFDCVPKCNDFTSLSFPWRYYCECTSSSSIFFYLCISLTINIIFTLTGLCIDVFLVTRPKWELNLFQFHSGNVRIPSSSVFLFVHLTCQAVNSF